MKYFVLKKDNKYYSLRSGFIPSEIIWTDNIYDAYVYRIHESLVENKPLKESSVGGVWTEVDVAIREITDERTA